MRRYLWGLLVLLAVAPAIASTVSTVNQESVTFTNKNSIDAQGDPDNNIDSATFVGGYTADGVRVTGSLTEVNTATFASEARVRLDPALSGAIDLQASAIGGFTGTIAVGPTVLTTTPFDPAGTMSFEWWEAFQDGTAGLPESRWNSVTYEFVDIQITNGNFAVGELPSDGTMVSTTGNNVSGGLDFYTFALSGTGVGNPLTYLNIQTSYVGGVTNDTEIGLYNSLGNLVATDDDGQVSPSGLGSMLSFGAADPLFNADTAAGVDGLTLAPGSYTLVVAGFNATFGATIGSITPGTASGNYDLKFTYVPEPASWGLLAIGALLFAIARSTRRS